MLGKTKYVFCNGQLCFLSPRSIACYQRYNKKWGQILNNWSTFLFFHLQSYHFQCISTRVYRNCVDFQKIFGKQPKLSLGNVFNRYFFPPFLQLEIKITDLFIFHLFEWGLKIQLTFYQVLLEMMSGFFRPNIQAIFPPLENELPLNR